jgi:capsular polysaccharide biosynthesis protein
MQTEPRSDVSSETTGGEYVVPLRSLLRTLRQWLWLIVLVVLTFSGFALGISLAQTPIYEASTTILVNRNYDRGEAILLANEVDGLQQLNLTMVEALNSQRVADAAINELNLRITPDQLLGNLRVEQVGETQFIQINYSDPNPERAQQIANTLGTVASEQISKLYPDTGITATKWEQAEEPAAPVSPEPMRNVILALALGLMVGVGLAFLLEYLDDSWRSPEEVEQISGVPTLGTVRTFR